jgi:lysozyme
MRPSSKSYDLIKCFEGFRHKAYYCPGMKLTVGYGTTRGVKPGTTVTHEQAVELLKRDVLVFSEVVNRLIKVPLNQNQFDALVSFVYNIGEGNFQKSTLLRLLNARKYEEASAQFVRWRFVKGLVMPGLVRRRDAERALFDKPIHEC